MKRAILICGIITALVASVFTAPALAYTKAQAELDALEYAQLHYSATATRPACYKSGKNKRGEAQWYCYGKYNFGTAEYKINVGPYGEITYHNP